ncbi:DNA ligase 6 [Iris pallida]|uniref:DNA ligase 6 n=1 Tax=Iris pallida TaxID=29817 RepID=A0AAX6DRS4_IRIPA|nr:DNA ligase 6 [Iris pallida]
MSPSRSTAARSPPSTPTTAPARSSSCSGSPCWTEVSRGTSTPGTSDSII